MPAPSRPPRLPTGPCAARRTARRSAGLACRSGPSATTTCSSRPGRRCSTCACGSGCTCSAARLRQRGARRRHRDRRGGPLAAGRLRPARVAACRPGRASSDSLADAVPDPAAGRLDVREVTLPIALDHPSAHEAMARYRAASGPTRPGARTTSSSSAGSTTCDEREDVFDIVAAATYLVRRARRRLPRRAGRGADRPAAPPGHHEVRPGPHLDAAERRRHRRRLPVRLRHGGARRVPARRPHRAGVAAPPGGSTERPWLLRQFDRLRFRPVGAEELADLRGRHQGRPRGPRDPAGRRSRWPRWTGARGGARRRDRHVRGPAAGRLRRPSATRWEAAR